MRDWRLEDEEEGDGPKPDAAAAAGGPVASALFKSRTVLIFGEVNMRMAERADHFHVAGGVRDVAAAGAVDGGDGGWA